VVETVIMDDFRPRWWLRSPHLQTFLGATGQVACVSELTKVHRIPTIDGEALALHEDLPLLGSPSSVATEDAFCDPVVLLIHGLGGSHRSGYLVRIASRLRELGVRVFRLDLRGSGAGEEWAYKPPHAGLTSDIADTVGWIEKHYHPQWLSLSGFSLGGNLVLKFLGELGRGSFRDRVDGDCLRHAVAVAPPIDLRLAADAMECGTGRFYSAYFLKLLNRHLQRKVELWPQWKSLLRSRSAKSIRQFDQWYTAPLSGFASADEYYEQSSSKSWLASIQLDVDLLVAADDPIVPIKSYNGIDRILAADVEKASGIGSIRFCQSTWGGHLGFVERWIGNKPTLRATGRLEESHGQEALVGRWMDRWVVDRIMESLSFHSDEASA
jgi:predicted alpha/beta-fold hydrolase